MTSASTAIFGIDHELKKRLCGCSAWLSMNFYRFNDRPGLIDYCPLIVAFSKNKYQGKISLRRTFFATSDLVGRITVCVLLLKDIQNGLAERLFPWQYTLMTCFLFEKSSVFRCGLMLYERAQKLIRLVLNGFELHSDSLLFMIISETFYVTPDWTWCKQIQQWSFVLAQAKTL